MIDLAGKKAVILGGKTGLLGQSLTEKLQAQDIITIPLSRSDFDPLNEESLTAMLERKNRTLSSTPWPTQWSTLLKTRKTKPTC